MQRAFSFSDGGFGGLDGSICDVVRGIIWAFDGVVDGVVIVVIVVVIIIVIFMIIIMIILFTMMMILKIMIRVVVVCIMIRIEIRIRDSFNNCSSVGRDGEIDNAGLSLFRRQRRS